MGNGTTDKFLCFLAGLGVGGVCALLLAPQSGRETRDEITRRAQEGREYLNKKVEEGSRRVSSEVTSVVERGREEVSGIVEKGKQVVHQQKDQLTAAYEAGKEAYREEKGSGK